MVVEFYSSFVQLIPLERDLFGGTMTLSDPDHATATALCPSQTICSQQ